MASTVDFSLLPEVIWAKIQGYLHLLDRYKVSLCCHKLNEAFNHPSLWHTEVISFQGQMDNYSPRGFTHSSNTVLAKTRRFGKYFQHLTIVISGHLRQFPDNWKEVLNEVAQQCRLDTLTLQIGQQTSMFHLGGYAPKKESLKVILSFLRNAFRMRKLAIRSWPMYELDNCEILDSLMANPKLTRLENLSLFLPEISETSWTERAPLLPSPSQTLTVVRQLQNLTHLGLRSTMISNELLDELAEPGRTKLMVMEIALHYLQHHDFQNFQVPFISSSAWKKLTNSCPELRVECTIMFRVSHMDIAKLLTPEVPLSMLKYMHYSYVDSQTLVSVGEHYHQTFRQLHVYCDTEQMDRILTEMVAKCTDMNDLVFCGKIGAKVVIGIAECRGERWKRFSVKEQNIVTPDEFETVPEDQVISEGDDGQYLLVAMRRFHQDEDVRTALIRHMTDKVSQALKYSWEPK